MNPPIRHDTITALCLGGLVTDRTLYTKEKIDQILSDPTDYRTVARTRQQLEAQTFKSLDTTACVRLSRLFSLKTVGLRMRVGQEMEYINFMYGVSAMPRGLVEFVDKSHWLIRTQHPNDVWKIQYACFTCADYAIDKNTEWISYDRRRIELEVTDIDSRAPGLQEGDERYVEVQIQRIKSDDDMATVSQVSDADLEDLFDIPQDQVEANSHPEPFDLNVTQVGELQDILDLTGDEVEIDLDIPLMEYDPMEDDLQIPPLENGLSGTELEQKIFSTSEPLFVRPQSQDDFYSQSNGQSDQENDHALSGSASRDVSGSQSKEQSDQQAEKSLLPESSPFVWHTAPKNTANRSVWLTAPRHTKNRFLWHTAPKNTENSRIFQTDSDDEDSQSQTESRFGDQVPQSTTNTEAEAERHRTIRKRLLRQVQQPLSPFSDIPNPHTEEEMESFHEWQELADLETNEQAETGVQEPIQSSSTSSEMREHGIKNPGATSQNATSIGKQPLTAFPKRFWSLSTCVKLRTISLYFLLLVVAYHSLAFILNRPCVEMEKE